MFFAVFSPSDSIASTSKSMHFSFKIVKEHLNTIHSFNTSSTSKENTTIA